MAAHGRFIAVIRSLGVRPMMKLSLPARRLLAYLALHGGSAARSAIAADLWIDCPEEVGRANLRRALWQVPHQWIDVFGDMLVLDAECDLEEARHVAARAMEGGRLTFDQVDTLCGDVLPGWHEEWAVAAHEEFRLIRVQALEATCRTLTAQSNHALAVRAGTAAVAAEPLRESATAALIEAHIAEHNRFEAVRCFRALVARLRDELGVPPEPELADRIAQIMDGRQAA